MSEVETQEEGVLRTFVLEDPEGSARALREWGGAKVCLKVHSSGKEPIVLVSGRGPGILGVTGQSLEVGLNSSWGRVQHMVRLDQATDICRVEVRAHHVFINGNAVIALTGTGWPSDTDARPRLQTTNERIRAGVHEAVVIGELNELLGDTVEHVTSINGLMTDLTAIAHTPSIRTLNIRLSDTKDISPLASLAKLQQLNLEMCVNLTDIKPLESLRMLETLCLSRTKLEDVSPIGGLQALERLDLSECHSLTDIDSLSKLENLLELNMSGCRKLTDLRPLSSLHTLNTLILSECLLIKDIDALAELESMQNLQLSECTGLAKVDALERMRALRKVSLRECVALHDIGGLRSAQHLRTLNLSGCWKLTEISSLSGLHALQTLGLARCERLTRVAPLRSCHALTSLDLSDSGNIRDLDTLSELPNLRELTWTETAAPHAVLAASAVLRGDADFAQASASDWLTSVPLSKAPDTFGLRLVRAFALGKDAPWAADALTRLATALRERARDDEDPQVITPTTWAAWADAAVVLQDDALRTALEAALTGLRPTREILPVLTPVLTALADLGSASAQRQGPTWLVPWVREVLAPLVAQEEPARQAAPAAAVFFAGFGLDTEVRAWLDRGTRAEAPHWRDRVVTALLAREVRRDDLAGARRWFAELVTDEARDAARATLAGAFAARLPVEAAAELEAIGDDALRGRVARQLGTEPALLATPAGLYALVLALQDDAEALGRTLVALVEAHPESALVTALARDLAPEAPGAPVAADPLPEVLAHPAWKDEIAGRKWEAFAGRLPSARALLAEAVAARAVAEGLLEAEVREDVVGRVG